jgi:YD repeat-containing protein
MTISTAVHSNAFNFMSFMQGGVDPRTGQYTVSLSLPDVKTNDLQGPGVPLTLGYNPLNTRDSGYGWGWNLQLSQYSFTDGNPVLSLSTGETFAVNGTRQVEGRTRLVMDEQKLKTFYAYEEEHPTAPGSKRYRIMHKSGLVEVLEMEGSGAYRAALPKEIFAPSGHKVTLAYNIYDGSPILKSITDGAGADLLTVLRSGNQLHINLAGGAAPAVQFLMKINASLGYVEEIILPTADKASWWFEYDIQDTYYGIKLVRTPVGGLETIEYRDGHEFPEGGPRTPLPRVHRHTTTPGSDQADMVVEYTYENDEGVAHNFLGVGANVTYNHNGRDNLYQHIGKYEYGSEETHVGENGAVRTIRRIFNQFHLLVRETTTQGHNVQTVATVYNYEDEESFEEQPDTFQLPLQNKALWKIDSENACREEITSSTYDVHGNLLTQTQPTGVTESNEWYDKDGEGANCPPDPQGFTRHLKSKTVIPATPAGNALALKTVYTYSAVPALAGSSLTDWIAPTSEMLSSVEAGVARELQRTAYTLYRDSTDALTLGRIAEKVITMNAKNTSTTYTYSKVASVPSGQFLLQTEELLTGFDHAAGRADVQKKVTLQHSVLNGEPLLNQDDNGVEIRYSYDVLRRVTSETVSPDTVFSATRRYAYTLCDNSDPLNPAPPAEQTMWDVKEVRTVTRFDGLNRAVYESRDDADSPDPRLNALQRQTYSARYDAWGDLVEETEYDWLDEEQKPLTSTYLYDDWGAQRCVIGPDGVRTYEDTNPIGTPEHDGPITLSWQEGADKQTGFTETWLNLFEKPVQTRRFLGKEDSGDLSGPTSLHKYSYDGLGRTTKEVVGLGTSLRETSFAYDAFDRMVENTLPGGAKVIRTFAEHSSEDLPIHISVAHANKTYELGSQRFDGLGRMVRSVTGGRAKMFTYSPGLSQPASVMTPSGQWIDYTYNPQLGEEPVTRTVRGESARLAQDDVKFDYDNQNARLLACSEGDSIVLQRTYFSTGEVKEETGTVGGVPYSMSYNFSRLGRLCSYTDVLSQTQTYKYDRAGRLSETTLGDVRASFTYDTLSQPSVITTLTNDPQHSLVVTLQHDEFGRETSRTFNFAGTTQTLTQVYNDVDCLTQRTLVEGSQLLRDETYAYDTRGRLTDYRCTPESLAPPVDPYGKAITRQQFLFDAIDNIGLCRTYFAGGDNRATYGYATEDPAQLRSVTNTFLGGDYPDITLDYDEDGNLTKDENGRTLAYDALGRLIRVAEGANTTDYFYDPLDKLSVHSAGASQDKLFYRDGVLANQVGTAQSSTFLRGGDHLLAEQRTDGTAVPSKTIPERGVK